MGKRIEDLRKLDDNPIERQVEALEANDARHPDGGRDDRHQAWYQLVAQIDNLLAMGDYDWAFDTLTGIKETVEHTRRVSEAQQKAVENIERSGQRRIRTSRRYEGFGGRGR